MALVASDWKSSLDMKCLTSVFILSFMCKSSKFNSWKLSLSLSLLYLLDPSNDGSLHGLLSQRWLQWRALTLQLLSQRSRRRFGCLGARPAGWVAGNVQRRHLALDRHCCHHRKHCGGWRCLCLHFLMKITTHTHTYPVFAGFLDHATVCKQTHSLSMSLSLSLSPSHSFRARGRRHIDYYNSLSE